MGDGAMGRRGDGAMGPRGGGAVGRWGEGDGQRECCMAYRRGLWFGAHQAVGEHHRIEQAVHTVTLRALQLPHSARTLAPTLALACLQRRERRGLDPGAIARFDGRMVEQAPRDRVHPRHALNGGEVGDGG